ncbi:MAG: F0F1 ATP synthase subunit gamma [Ruminococcaceae bacterium]|nr:F0F1 ATP synthase subunit gamma [Oscillospiraceae bacterium]
MPAIQSLKKQLKGILSTKKLTNAMKTVSTVKFSKLNSVFGEYSEYSRACQRVLEIFGKELLTEVSEADSSAPQAVIIIASNKGLCGNFNSELLNYALEQLGKFKSPYVYACGKKAISFLRSKNITLNKEIVFDDIPDYTEVSAIFDELIQLRKSGEISKVYIIYSSYKNMMLQKPVCVDFFNVENGENESSVLFVPNKQIITQEVSKSVFKAMFYEKVLESAIGAQASTLMTMRSAYDTATEYAENLEKEINRLRQGAVTADVIETSAEREVKK